MQKQGVRIADLERERDAARSLCAAGEAIDLWFSYKCLQARLDEDEKWHAVSRAAKAVALGRKQVSWTNKHGSEQEQQAAQEHLLAAQAAVEGLERELKFGAVKLTALVGVKRARNKQSHVLESTVKDQQRLITQLNREEDLEGLLPPGSWQVLQPLLGDMTALDEAGQLIDY
jgi:hypothetical protein